MSILEAVRVALTALTANKLRSLLTSLGVIIGVWAVIAAVALAEGARRDILERIQSLGSNLLYVAPGQAERGRIWRGFGSAETVTIEECRQMRFQLASVAGVAPEISGREQVKFGSANNNSPISGTLADYNFVRNANVVEGRFFTSLDDGARRRVAVLGSQIAIDLFGETYPVGKRIKIRNVPFTVIGVMAEKGGFGREDDKIIIPMSSMRQRFNGTKYINMCAVTLKEGFELSDGEKEIRRYLRRAHKLRPSQEDDFSISTQQDMLAMVDESNKVMRYVLGGIAMISLLVGGIGVMNIMLVTVTERTREIGIRKALGARPWDIRTQFLIEAMVLSVMGGLIGVALGIFTARAVGKTETVQMVVSTSSVLMAFLCAAGTGVFFGYYPASQAAKLDPIEALRYE